MARPRKKPDAPVPDEFKPSPLPTPFELSSIAAALLPKDARTSEGIRGAVDAALALWGAAIARTGERAVEMSRLEYAPDHAAGAKRWTEWQRRHLGIWEQMLDLERKEAEWTVRGEEIFKGFEWPASFDDVMRRVMEGSVMDKKEGERHSVFSKVWVEAYLPKEKERRTSEGERQQPLIGDIVEEFAKDGLTMKQMEAKYAKAIEKCRRSTAAACEAARSDLEKAAARFRTEKLTFDGAVRMLRVWRGHSRSEQNSQNARKRKKKR